MNYYCLGRLTSISPYDTYLRREYIEKGVKTTEKYEKIRSKPLRSVYLAEVLEHINVSRRWEE